jgi:hypothetical protein
MHFSEELEMHFSEELEMHFSEEPGCPWENFLNKKKTLGISLKSLLIILNIN